MLNLNIYEKNISKLKLYAFLTKVLFYSPVLIAFLKNNHLSAFQILSLFSIMSFITFILEIPSGHFADKYGRKNSLLIATFALFLSSIIFWFASVFNLFIVAAVLLGISGAFRSGADSALLYDTLIILKKEKEHKKIRGSIKAYNAWALTISSFSSTLIVFYFDLKYTFLFSSIFFICALFITFTLKEPKHKVKIEKNIPHITTSIKECLYNKKLLMITLFSSSTFLFIDVSQRFDQMYYLLINLDIKWFGILFGIFAIISGIITKYTYIIEKKLGLKNSLLLIIVLPIISFIFLGLNKTFWGLIAIFLVNIMWGFPNVIINDYSQKLIHSKNRATMLSIQNQIFSIFYFIVPLVLGYIADLFSSINKIYLVMAIFIFIFSFYPTYYLIKNKVN